MRLNRYCVSHYSAGDTKIYLLRIGDQQSDGVRQGSDLLSGGGEKYGHVTDTIFIALRQPFLTCCFHWWAVEDSNLQPTD